MHELLKELEAQLAAKDPAGRRRVTDAILGLIAASKGLGAELGPLGFKTGLAVIREIGGLVAARRAVIGGLLARAREFAPKVGPHVVALLAAI